MAAPVFAVFFAERSPAIPDAAFSRVDATHWVLDVPPAAAAARDIGLTLLAPNALAPDAALGLYVSVGGKDWAWRGYVSNDRPSEIAPTAWPAADGAPGAAAGARVGVSLEPRAEAEAKESSRATSRLDFARAVGQDLYNFLASYGGTRQQGDALVVPAGVLDRWFARVTTKLRLDPEWLSRQSAAA